jgi:hypothetical protein
MAGIAVSPPGGEVAVHVVPEFVLVKKTAALAPAIGTPPAKHVDVPAHVICCKLQVPAGKVSFAQVFPPSVEM